jgi:hypothetical protein
MTQDPALLQQVVQDKWIVISPGGPAAVCCQYYCDVRLWRSVGAVVYVVIGAASIAEAVRLLGIAAAPAQLPPRGQGDVHEP